MKQYDAKRTKRKDPSEYSPNYRKPPPNQRAARIPECGHPERKHTARGMCQACYQKAKPGWARATCHPDRPVLAGGLCSRCYGKRKYHEDPEKARREANESHRKAHKRNREEMLAAYGGKCACPKCPETNPAFLTLEHVNGDGAQHRKAVGRGHAVADLRRRGWPQEGYTLLCMNCNFATRNGRICPHVES